MGLGSLRRHRASDGSYVGANNKQTIEESMKKPTGVPAIDEHYINSEPYSPTEADLRTQAKVVDNAANENLAFSGEVSDDVLETLNKSTEDGLDEPAPHKSSLKGKEDVVDKTFVRTKDGDKLDEVNETDEDTAEKLGEKQSATREKAVAKSKASKKHKE